MSMCKTLAATILAGTMLFAGSAAAADKAPSGTASSKDGKAMELVQEWDKVFPRSDKVEHRKVTFRTRYGTVLAGDLYVPRDARGKLAALAVSGPFGAVKEQASGLYAQTMAERGFLTLAFDPSYTGESSGEPRHVASPDHALRFRQGRREADRLKSPSPWGIMAYGFPSSRPGRVWTFASPPAGQGALPGGVWCAGPLRYHAAIALWHSFC